MWSQLPSYATVSRSIQSRLPRRWSKSQRCEELPPEHRVYSPPTLPIAQAPVKDIIKEDATPIAVSFNTLPTDILHRIFMDVGSNVFYKIRVTHVCKHWRTTALSFPLMWTNLDLDYLSGLATVAMVLQRSKGLPLSLHCSAWSALRHSVCRSEIHRARELDLEIDSYSLITLRSFLEHTPAPSLVRCKIMSSTYEIQAPPIFAKQCPLLQDLTLTNCRMAYTAGNYTGLRRLELRCTIEPDVTYPDDECLMEVFKWCPDLEEVVLHGCAVHSELTKAYIGHGHDVVRLPKLRSMDLRLRTSSVHAITSSVQPSPECLIRIAAYTCPKNPVESQILSENSPFIAQAFGMAKALVIDGITSKLYAFTDAELQFEYMRIHLDFQHSHDFYDLLLRPSITSNLLPDLQSLHLRRISDQNIIHLLRSLPSLKSISLCFDEPDLQPGIWILSSMEVEAKSGLCPELQSISLCGASLDMFTRSVLSQLRSHSPNLRNLSLYRCKLDVSVDAAMSMLKDFEKVVWYGDQPPPFYQG